MTLWRCATCGSTFGYPSIEQDPYALPGEGAGICPDCGSDAIEDGQECPECGGWSAGGLCRECRDALKERFAAVIRDAFTETEIAALNGIYDGEEFP